MNADDYLTILRDGAIYIEHGIDDRDLVKLTAAVFFAFLLASILSHTIIKKF